MKINFKKNALSILLILIATTIFAQVRIDTAFKVPYNENIHYRVYYKLANFWVYAAIADLKTDTMTFENKKVYKLYAEGFTRKKYNWIYSLEDHYASYTDINTFKPLKFEKHNIEKKITYRNIYNFDWNNKTVNMLITQSKKDTIEKTEKLPDFITDEFSAVHYLRTVDFSSYKPGNKFSYKTILDGNIFKQEFIYRGTDTLTDVNGKKYRTFVVEALIKNSYFFSKKEGVIVWITDNKERWIAKINAKILVGNIVVFMRENDVSFDLRKK